MTLRPPPQQRDGRGPNPRPPRPSRRLDRRRRRARQRARQRRTLLVLAVVLLAVSAAGSAALHLGWNARPTAVPATPASTVIGTAGAASVSPAPAPSDSSGSDPSLVAQKGTGGFSFAEGQGRVLGSAGAVKRFRVAVEEGTRQDAAAFASAVEQVLGDQRSWIANGQLRLQRVPWSAAAEFTIYLASPVTSEQMCLTGGLQTHQVTSCRIGGQVIINLARWLTAVSDYGAPLSVYRAYALNHEVGHELGRGHEACPGRGRLAPVMQQQTLGLQGCTANSWPYVNGQRYAGPAIA